MDTDTTDPTATDTVHDADAVTDRRVGTVELLAERVYPLDPRASVDDATVSTVAVPPGRYPLYRRGEARYWMMTGRLNIGPINQIGRDMFTLGRPDTGVGPVVRFPSKLFWDGELEQMQADNPIYQDGSDSQRVRFLLDDVADGTIAESALAEGDLIVHDGTVVRVHSRTEFSPDGVVVWVTDPTAIQPITCAPGDRFPVAPAGSLLGDRV